MSFLNLTDPYAFRSGSKPRNSINFVAVPLEDRPAVPGLTVQALADLLGLGDFLSAGEETQMQAILNAAIERCVAFSGYEPVSRAYEFRYDAHPADLRYRGGAGPEFEEVSPWIEIPRRPVSAITSVTVSGEAISDFNTDLLSNPPRVQFPITVVLGPEMAQIQIEATVGATGDPDPMFVQAVLFLAALMYENRGCKPGSAMLKDSGALSMLRSLKVRTGGL